MQWSEFGPYVLPHVIGCPEPVLIHHAKLATMNWCRKTLCLQKWLDPVNTIIGNHAIELDLDTGLQIVKIKQVHIDKRNITLLHQEKGRALASEGAELEQGVFLDSLNTLYILQTPEKAEPVTVYACLSTSMASTTFSDELAEHLSDIAYGVIASIQMLPKQAFTDTNSAMVNAGMFKSRVDSISAKVGRGMLSAKMHGGRLINF